MLWKIISLFAGAWVCAAPASSLAGTSAPFYFVEQNGNQQGLYTDTRCNGIQGSCVGSGRYCNTNFYSSTYTLDQGKKNWAYRGYIGIRQISRSFGVVCKLEK